MEGSRQSLMRPLVVALVTAGLTWGLDRIPAEGSAATGALPAVMALLLFYPFIVSALWAWALMTGPQIQWTLAIAGITSAGILVLVSPEVGWQAVVDCLAGLVAGWVLLARWRLDAGWIAVVACLAPLLVWSMSQLPVQDTLQEMRTLAVTNLEQTLWLDLEEPELSRARQQQEQRIDQTLNLVARVYPSFLAVGMIGQAGLVLLLGMWLGRWSGVRTRLRGGAPFLQWRLPFYVVWGLVAGLGLLLTRAPYLAAIGLNLALVAVLLLMVQGITVQAYFVSRLMSGPMQVVFWLIMGFPLFAVLVASSLVLGLADQWFDLRRRHREYEAREVE